MNKVNNGFFIDLFNKYKSIFIWNKIFEKIFSVFN